MTRFYAWAFATLGFVLAILAIIVVVFVLKVSTLQDELRTRDQLAAVTKVVQCRQQIHTVAVANAVIDNQRSDLEQRARQALQLANADPTKKLAAVHTAIADELRTRALELVDFPAITKKTCDDLAARLGVAR